LEIELGGATAADHDVLQVTGSVALDGRLELSLFGGYDPAYLVPHTVLTAASRTGVFDTVGGVVLNAAKALAVTYTSNSVLVTATRPGDADVSGVVNLADFNALATNFGTSGKTWVNGDFNGNGVVDLADFNHLATNFGLSVGPEGPTPLDWSTLASAVPEPQLASFLAILLALRFRHRRL
jgi:hypothetical protein